METAVTIAAVLLGLVGLALVADIIAVWRAGEGALETPERAQLATGAAVLAFTAAFFVVQVGGGESAPAADTDPPSSDTAAQRAVDELATPARLPRLASRPAEPEPEPEPERQPREPQPEPAEDPPTTTTTTPTTTTTTPTTTTPVTPTTTPAPEPQPEPPPEETPFDSRE